MKKVFTFLLALVIVFGFMGCGDTVDAFLDVAGVMLEADSTSDAPNVTDDLLDDLEADTTDEPEVSDTERLPSDTTVSALPDETPSIDEDGLYYSAEDVALYLYTYGHLPGNFITKSEARELGWEGGSVEAYSPDCAIGGDKFGNREGLLPKANGRQYYECDIDTHGEDSRGAKRLVYSNDGLIYYTEDHYETFTLLYGEE